MVENENEIVQVKENKTKIIVMGVLLGAAVGGIGAALFVNAKGEDEISVTPGEGIKIGLMLLGLLRSISSLAD